MTAQQSILADLEGLPATAVQRVAEFVHQLRQRGGTEAPVMTEPFGANTADTKGTSRQKQVADWLSNATSRPAPEGFTTDALLRDNRSEV